MPKKMFRADRLIATCRSWPDFWDAALELSENDKGIAFERLTQLYLQTHPKYVTELAQVWLTKEMPTAVRSELNLPQTDEGIDLIARARDGGHWAIQAEDF